MIIEKIVQAVFRGKTDILMNIIVYENNCFQKLCNIYMFFS